MKKKNMMMIFECVDKMHRFFRLFFFVLICIQLIKLTSSYGINSYVTWKLVSDLIGFN